MKSLLALILLFTAATAVANELGELKQQQQRLQQLLDEINQSEQQRQRQKDAMARLQKQLECNWSLIQAYESCEQNHQDDPQQLLQCTQEAKAQAAKCLAPLAH
jgi:lipid A disaccharide synthetase